MKMFSVYDRQACQFGPVVCHDNTTAAKRSFVAFLASGDSFVHQWPDDFALFYIGDFDASCGLISAVSPVEQIMTAREALILSQGRGAAVGGTASAVPPEDSGASAERDNVPTDGSFPGVDTTPALPL